MSVGDRDMIGLSRFYIDGEKLCLRTIGVGRAPRIPIMVVLRVFDETCIEDVRPGSIYLDGDRRRSGADDRTMPAGNV